MTATIVEPYEFFEQVNFNNHPGECAFPLTLVPENAKRLNLCAISYEDVAVVIRRNHYVPAPLFNIYVTGSTMEELTLSLKNKLNKMATVLLREVGKYGFNRTFKKDTLVTYIDDVKYEIEKDGGNCMMPYRYSKQLFPVFPDDGLLVDDLKKPKDDDGNFQKTFLEWRDVGMAILDVSLISVG